MMMIMNTLLAPRGSASSTCSTCYKDSPHECPQSSKPTPHSQSSNHLHTTVSSSHIHHHWFKLWIKTFRIQRL
ncbi:hypothetical protein LINPERPRIM_LOCUS32429 [Linum perenne]